MSDTRKLVRVQDREGRGPWRPGFSSTWVGDDTPMHGKPIPSYPGALKAALDACEAGMQTGCAVFADQIGLWFSPADLDRLARLGFYVADASACKVIFIAPDQALVASHEPMALLPEYRP